MNKKLRALLENWPNPYLNGVNFLIGLDGTADSRQAMVRRAVQEGSLIHLRRDLYLVNDKSLRTLPVDVEELSSILYGPSYVSFESALAFHGWIPESVPVLTCATTKRSREFEAPVGTFSYRHIPLGAFHMGLCQIVKEEAVVFIADPWKAVADWVYTGDKNWTSLNEL